MRRLNRLFLGVCLAIFGCIAPVAAAIGHGQSVRLSSPFFYLPPVSNDKASKSASNTVAGKCRRNIEISSLLRKYDHAIKRYLETKTKSILIRNTYRVKKGKTLSGYFPDYRNYSLVVRLLDGREAPLKKQKILDDYYLWKEGQRIIMGADVMLMSQQAKDRVLRKAAREGRRRWAADEYRRVAEKTRRVATSTAFRLDCQHVADLDGLVNKAIDDLMARDDDRVISPRTFDKLLTILRAYITFNYYKDLSHDDFGERFKQLGRKVGRGIWSHQKLTRLLGLHVMGRIESNRAFRQTYAKAIERAARRTPTIPRKWIEEIIWIETKGDPMTISRAGAYGLMQLMPLVYIGQGPEKSRQLPLSFERTINPFNAETNIERGAAFLDKLRRMLKPYMRGYARSTQKKIIFHAYNCGVTKVISLLKKYGLGYRHYLPGETKTYLKKLADFPYQ